MRNLTSRKTHIHRVLAELVLEPWHSEPSQVSSWSSIKDESSHGDDTIERRVGEEVFPKNTKDQIHKEQIKATHSLSFS